MAQARNKESRTILITRFSAVGDIAMTIPLLYSLAATYPMHRFVLVSRKRFGQFLINAPQNLLFRGVEPDNYKGVFGLYRLYKELNEEYSPDSIADLHDVLRTKILRIFFSRGRRIEHIIKGRAEKRRLTCKYNKHKEQLTSTFNRYRDVFTRLGLPFTPNFVSLFANKRGDISEFSEVLPAKGSDKWLGIAPFARHKGKIYPIELMRRVVEILSKQKGLKIVCFGNGPQEELVVNGWCRDFDNVISFIGKSNFNGELRLASHLDAMLCMDSANMHIASLVNTPALSVWGATSPLAGFLGWNQKTEDCIQLPIECRPCSIFGNRPCRYGDYRCMDIPPQKIADIVINRLQLNNNG